MAYLVLVLLTILMYLVAEVELTGSMAVTACLLAAVAFKGTIIISEFMELRGVSFIWRAIMYGWLWVVTLSLLVTYIFTL